MSVNGREILLSRRLCLGAAAIYFLLMLSAVSYFEMTRGMLKAGNVQVLFAYFPALFCAGFFGYRFAHWYEIIENERNILEIIFAPIWVLFLSISCASLCWGFSFELFEKHTGFHFWPYIFLAVSSSLVFIYFTWPILLVGGIAASLLIDHLEKFLTSRCRLARRYRN